MTDIIKIQKNNQLCASPEADSAALKLLLALAPLWQKFALLGPVAH